MGGMGGARRWTVLTVGGVAVLGSALAAVLFGVRGIEVAIAVPRKSCQGWFSCCFEGSSVVAPAEGFGGSAVLGDEVEDFAGEVVAGGELAAA
jgi:hypothetical protein